MALVTRAEVKTHLNIPSNVTTDDDELDDFIDVASDLVEGYADRKFTSMTGTSYFDGGGDLFVLPTAPVASVVSVAVSGVTLASTTYGVDLANGVVHTDTATYADTQNVTIVYTAGSATIPNLVKHATKEAVRHLWETQRGTGRGRNPRGGDDYTAGASFSLPRRVMELLDPLRSV